MVTTPANRACAPRRRRTTCRLIAGPRPRDNPTSWGVSRRKSRYGRLELSKPWLGSAGAQSLTATLDGGNVNGLLYNPANANGEREAGISFGPGSHTLVAAATHPWNGATNYFSKTTNTFTAQANSTIDVQYDGTKADLESLQQSVESKRRLQFR